jgi:hypothetical protein
MLVCDVACVQYSMYTTLFLRISSACLPSVSPRHHTFHLGMNGVPCYSKQTEVNPHILSVGCRLRRCLPLRQAVPSCLWIGEGSCLMSVCRR